MAIRTRRTLDERIAAAQEKVKALEEKKRKAGEAKARKAKPKAVALNKESAGVAELLNQLDAVAKQNGVKVAEVIKALAKLKRTGLKIEHRLAQFDDVMGL